MCLCFNLKGKVEHLSNQDVLNDETQRKYIQVCLVHAVCACALVSQNKHYSPSPPARIPPQGRQETDDLLSEAVPH